MWRGVWRWRCPKTDETTSSKVKSIVVSLVWSFIGCSILSREICYAVSSRSRPQRWQVKNGLTKFVKNELYKNERLIIYVLTEKQDSYSSKGFDEIIQGKCRFEKTGTLLITASRSHFLARHFSLFDAPEREQTEPEDLNLFEVFVPKVPYQADLDIDHVEVIRNSV